MKKIAFTLTSLLLLLTSILVAQHTDHHDDFGGCNKANAQAKWLELRGINTFEDLSFDLNYYRFEWYIDPGVYQISGTATSYFTAKEANLSVMELNLSTALTVSTVKYHGNNITFSQNGDYGLTINLPAPLANGTKDSLSITYQGVPPAGGFGSFIQSTHNGTPVIWTLSEPFGAQDWWPCKNGLTDKVDSIDVIVTTPSTYRVASNGLLASETASGANKVYHWKHRYAIAPYLVAIAVTDYATYTDIVPLSNGTQMPMLNYVYPENLAEAQAGTADLVQVLQFYDSLFVTYPFYKEKYGHAQFGWGGGMEHQTMSYVINYGWGLLSHELAHQWFGDMVTCGSWEDIWLNEGFATFLEGLTRERFGQTDNWWTWRAGKISQICGQPGGSVQVDDTTSVNRIFSGRLSYSKGSYLLHMLRWKLGDDVFFQGVRNYLNDRQYNYARTPMLKTHLEQVSGQDLTEFFADWFSGQGFPSYTIQWDKAENTVVFKVQQVTSHPSVSFFEMPLPIRVTGPAGQDTIVRLENTFSGQVFTVDLPFKATSVTFDPELWLLSNNNVLIESNLTGTANLAGGFRITLSPNPVKEMARLEITGTQSIQNGTLWHVFDHAGREVKSGTIDGSVTIFSVQDLPAGVYELLVNTAEGKRTTVSFVK